MVLNLKGMLVKLQSDLLTQKHWKENIYKLCSTQDEPALEFYLKTGMKLGGESPLHLLHCGLL